MWQQMHCGAEKGCGIGARWESQNLGAKAVKMLNEAREGRNAGGWSLDEGR